MRMVLEQQIQENKKRKEQEAEKLKEFEAKENERIKKDLDQLNKEGNKFFEYDHKIEEGRQ